MTDLYDDITFTYHHHNSTMGEQQPFEAATVSSITFHCDGLPARIPTDLVVPCCRCYAALPCELLLHRTNVHAAGFSAR